MMGTRIFLGWILIGLGGLGLLAGLVATIFPRAVRAGLQAFPRSRGMGWVLTLVCVVWVAWVVQHAALGRFEGLKPLVPVAAVVLLGAVVYFLDELLAPRALGGLLMLVANPVLMGVRWVDSPWRFVPVLLAYAWVVAGCGLMLYPWLFRKAAERLVRTEGQLRRWGWAKATAGAVLLAAGAWHLR